MMELRVEHLCKRYGENAVLDDISFTARVGVTRLLGPSGIGKTLLGDILAAHYKPRRIDCGSISSPVALAGEESGYNNSTYGMLADAALDQADLLQFTGVDRITFGGQNGNPFPALIQLVREHTVHDLYLGTSVHVNANIIAEAESTASLPADLISAFDAVIAMPAPTREERLAFGKALFDTLNTRSGLVLEPDVLPWLLDHYCPDEGMTNLKTSVERLFHAASNAPDPALPITIPAAEKSLGAAQLSEYENYYIHELSGGMKQRVALLRAMACDPKVLLMDEPLGAVDFQMRQLLQMQLEQMLMQKKTTALMVTHDVDEAVYLSDRVIVMSRDYGRILTDLRIDLPRPRDRTHVMYHNYVDQLTNVLKSALNGDVKNDEDKDLLEFIQKSELEKNRLHNALFGDADKK